jgi:hypothetical protein
MEITRGIIRGAQKIAIYGPEGIGKSSLAAMFPTPIFIDTEGSTKHMDVARTPVPSSWTMLLNQIDYFKSNPKVCDTLVIDTADWAEQLCIAHICSKSGGNKTSIEDFGYGKGYTILSEEFGRLLNLLNELIDLGINVVLTAHAMMRKFEQPDEMGAYDRWELKLQKKTAPLVKEWADMVLFCNYKTHVVNSESNGKGTNKVQGGKRVIYTTHHACWDAKNRHGLPEQLSFNSPEDGYSQIAHCIVTRNSKPASTPTKPLELAQDLDDITTEPEIYYYHNTNDDSIFTSKSNEPVTINKKRITKEEYEKIKQRKEQQARLFPEMTKRAETPEPPKQEPVKEKPDEETLEDIKIISKPLYDLMKSNNVTVKEIQIAVSLRGICTADTPIANYDPAYIDGCLVGAWPQVLDFINNNIRKNK